MPGVSRARTAFAHNLARRLSVRKNLQMKINLNRFAVITMRSKWLRWFACTTMPVALVLGIGASAEVFAQGTSNSTTANTAFGSRSYAGTQQSSRTSSSNSSAMGQSGSMGGSALGQSAAFGASSRQQGGGFVGGGSQNARSVGNVMAGQAGSNQMGGMGQNMMSQMGATISETAKMVLDNKATMETISNSAIICCVFH